MKIQNVVHSGLLSLIAEDGPAGPRSIEVSRLRRILSFLQDMAGASELRCIAGWTAQPPSGAGQGKWEIRAASVGVLTFKIDAPGGEIADLDYEGAAEPWAQAQ